MVKRLKISRLCGSEQGGSDSVHMQNAAVEKHPVTQKISKGRNRRTKKRQHNCGDMAISKGSCKLLAPFVSPNKTPKDRDVSERRKRKKRQLVQSKCGDPIDLPSHSCSGGQNLLPWLRNGGACFEALEVRNDGPVRGLGAFARRTIKPGDVVFTLPTKMMLTLDVAKEDEVVARAAAILCKWGESEVDPFLMCLRLCRAQMCSDDPFHIYATSLPVSAPGVAAWPRYMREFLRQSSLGASIAFADAELDRWGNWVRRMMETDPIAFQPHEVLERQQLEWARGMLQSRHFSFVGGHTMVPLLDILNHKDAADVTIRLRDGMLEFISDERIEAGEQIWNNYGPKGNAELLLCCGFATDDNHYDTVSLGMSCNNGGTLAQPSAIVLTASGVPEEVIDAIEKEGDDLLFLSLLRSCMQRKEMVETCLKQLETVFTRKRCKRPYAQSRKQLIELFFKGELKVLQVCLEEMRSSIDVNDERSDDGSVANIEEGDEESSGE